jgi:large subunit ribosomal protein L10
MKRDEKRQQAEALRKDLEQAKGVVLSGFEGLTVAQETELRRRIAQAGAKYKVVKNSLIERAAQGTPVEPIATKLRGTTSVAYTQTDPVTLAKALTAYAKENPLLVFKAGMVEGRVVSLAEFNALATLPSRDVLLSQVASLANAPARRLASAVAALARNLAVVLQQAVKEGKFKEA